MNTKSYNGKINKRQAHAILILGDLLCLWVIWSGFNSYMDVLTVLNNQADIIRFSSRSGFFIVCICAPLIHLLILVEYFWPAFVKKRIQLVSQCVVILVVSLLVAGIFGSYWIQNHAEKAGYFYCRNASGASALAKTLVYTKTKELCGDLVETERKREKR